MSREVVDLPCASLQGRVIAGHELCERDMNVRKSNAGARRRAVRDITHDVPGAHVARMPGEFPAPQKGNRIIHLPMRRSAVHFWCEGFREEPARRRCVACFERAEREMPTEVAVE